MDRRRTTITISVIFALALFMGPGPVSALVDGSKEAPNYLFGVPVLYLWAVFWWLVMAGCVLAAARFLWGDES
jgi:hypothetical protein